MASFITEQVTVFLQSFSCGFLIWLVYDIFLIFRMTWKHRGFFVVLENILFWLVAASAIFDTFYEYNYGNLRAYAFIGVFLGIFLHNFIITKSILWTYGIFLSWFRRKICPIVKILSKKMKNMLKQVKKSIIVSIRSMI